ncbi:nicotinate phosphoribosyltransferase [Spirosoma utsteinense]|uniref:Nicotinate phosphoribosyltransferase n=1 Tax=Spirosoma utsteinense TaxID=2585773 RepID=A0ABR6VZW5_9BACT|nr:nicotinate phosphoribosyltransferase [Spirosoma utsteinense]MBC3786516.1 nicotinate phosphoribosyltransferase [Spirosoma utsteinense]MBC3789892.1 nicotinate phosphoribosyltransferase [Spirosoma utsteinense]
MTNKLYDTSLSLLTDLYQVTMAYGYWKAGMTDDRQPSSDSTRSGAAEKEAVFNLYFRKNPFSGGFTVSGGLTNVIGYINNFGFSRKDLRYLRSLTGSDGQPLFEEGFLTYLANLKLSCDIDAIPEGTVVFPNEPLLRVRGPILQCQLLETPLLNLVNFESLITTKAARLRLVAGTDTLLEFGLRRAQGADGGMTASRAAYIGGFDATSNVLAGKLYDIPVRGTHAHSWVMSFDTEQEAFDTYAEMMPNNVTLLVDTYDTLEGVKHAIQTGHKLRQKGYALSGIRLDSGDLAYLSIEARKLLDAAGFTDTAIVASNDLDEIIINSLKQQGAKITVWGVGTKLVTAYDQPALGGVYKLAAVRQANHADPDSDPAENHTAVRWDYKMKLSEQAIKISTPGIQQVRRFRDERGFLADMIFDEERSADDLNEATTTMIDPLDFTKRRRFEADQPFEDLLVPVFRGGEQVYDCPDIHATRARVQEQLAGLHPGVKRFVNPHTYPVGLEKSLHELKTELILKLREGGRE